MYNSYDRTFNVSKREIIRRKNVSDLNLNGTIYYITTKIFNCQKKKNKNNFPKTLK